jgi:SAM-dependent methyltransferase
MSTPSKEKLLYGAINWDLIEYIPESASRILDVGCGTGLLGKFIKSRQPAEVVGLTYSADESMVANQNLDSTIVIDLNEPHLDLDRIGTFDCVICSHVLEHLYWPENFVKFVTSLIRKDGVFIVALPNLLYWRQRWELIRGRFRYTEGGVMDKTHFRFFDFHSAKSLMDVDGLRIVRHIGPGHFPGTGMLGPFGVTIDRLAVYLFPGLFSVQIIVVANKE